MSRLKNLGTIGQSEERREREHSSFPLEDIVVFREDEVYWGRSAHEYGEAHAASLVFDSGWPSTMMLAVDVKWQEKLHVAAEKLAAVAETKRRQFHRIARLEERVERVEREVAALKACIAPPSLSSYTHVPERLSESDIPKVRQLTARLFPGQIQLTADQDPEIPSDIRLVFHVWASGSIDEIVALEAEWHRGICDLDIDSPALYRLSIDVD